MQSISLDTESMEWVPGTPFYGPGAIYQGDREMPRRKSHEKPAVQQLYAGFLGKPLGEKSHELLHTHYTPRGAGRGGEQTPACEETLVGSSEK